MNYLELMKKAKATTTDTTKAPDAVQSPGPLDSPAPTEPTDIRTARTLRGEDEHRRLLVAGFKPKERGGLVVWANPETGFYFSQEMAAYFLGRGTCNTKCNSGAEGER